MIVKYKKLHPAAEAPVKKHDADAGFDLSARSIEYAPFDAHQLTVHTGIAIDIPEGYVGLLFPRSSIAKTDMSLSNSVGVIDAGYHGEVMAKFNFHGPSHYKAGDRCVQLVIIPIPRINMQEDDDFQASSRGAGGYGSTGDRGGVV